MNDPRYIPPSDREGQVYATADERALLDHATLMDERDARQRGLIRRLADGIRCGRTGFLVTHPANSGHCGDCEMCLLVVEARGVEATNEH